MKRIAIQGDRGSFHEVAAKHYFGDEIDILPCSTFDKTIGAVTNDLADTAVIAIENSRTGSLLYNYTILRESGLKISGEVNLRIHQNLLALPGQTMETIREVHSHPVAISQCMDYLNRYPDIKLIETEDTAGSARLIRELGLINIAAIASSSAASIYNLEILSKGIETYKQNFTRFIICSDKPHVEAKMTKASVCFSLGHKPGTLASILVFLADQNINLTKIQSIPRMSDSWQYLFYMDIELDQTSDYNEIFKLLGERTDNLEILGVYNKNDTIYES